MTPFEVISYNCDSDAKTLPKEHFPLLFLTTKLCGMKGPLGLSSYLLSNNELLKKKKYLIYTNVNGFEIVTYYDPLYFALSCGLFFTVGNIHATVSFCEYSEPYPPKGTPKQSMAVRILNVYFAPVDGSSGTTNKVFEDKLNTVLSARKAIPANSRGNIIYKSDGQSSHVITIPENFVDHRCPTIIIYNGKPNWPSTYLFGEELQTPKGVGNFFSDNSLILFSSTFSEINGRSEEKTHKNSSGVFLSFKIPLPAKPKTFLGFKISGGGNMNETIEQEEYYKRKYLIYKRKYLELKNN